MSLFSNIANGCKASPSLFEEPVAFVIHWLFGLIALSFAILRFVVASVWNLTIGRMLANRAAHREAERIAQQLNNPN